MTTSTASPLSHRDRSVLRAVAAGRCALTGPGREALLVDGLCCADQFVAARLTAAGLIGAEPPWPGPSGAEGDIGPAYLTRAGRALLDAA